MTDAQMPTEAHDIDSKLAQADPVWAHLAGQIEALTWAQTEGSGNGSNQKARKP